MSCNYVNYFSTLDDQLLEEVTMFHVKPSSTKAKILVVQRPRVTNKNYCWNIFCDLWKILLFFKGFCSKFENLYLRHANFIIWLNFCMLTNNEKTEKTLHWAFSLTSKNDKLYTYNIRPFSFPSDKQICSLQISFCISCSTWKKAVSMSSAALSSPAWLHYKKILYTADIFYQDRIKNLHTLVCLSCQQ